jgi:CheY-like chemotaxis protein
LLVEDDALAREVSSELLERNGCNVEAVASGAAAVRLWEASVERFDVLLCDVNLPDMNGLNLLERLRSQHPGLPAVVLTGFATSDRQFEGLRHDRRTLLMQKPVDLVRLARELRSLASGLAK